MPNKETHSQNTSIPVARPEGSNLWTPREVYLLALVCLLSGLVMGYLFHGSSPTAVPTAVSASSPGPAQGAQTPAPLPTAQDLAPLTTPMLNALKVDPKNSKTLIELGNIYYDHQVFAEAITYYTRALEVEPKNVNVRTDLGTAYWYSGFPEKAVVEYEKSLAVDPAHVNTVFNMGVVRMEGLKDSKGAVKYFEKLLTMNVSPEQRAKAEELLAKAKGTKS